MKILVTGATGFVASYLLPSLQLQHDVFALARRHPSEGSLQGVRWVEQDLTRPLDYARLPSHVDAIIHLAQSRCYKQFPDKAQDIYDVNIDGTFQLLEYARRIGVEHFVFASSGGVYAYSPGRIMESSPMRPQGFYLNSKYIAELLLANYQEFFRTVILRFFFVYGPGQQGMLIPTLRQRVQNNLPIAIEGNPGLRINPINIADVVRAFEPALRLQESAEVNVAGDDVVTITDLVKLLAQVSGKEKDLQLQYTEVTQSGDLVGDNTRMKEVLGVCPRTSLLEGLRQLD